MKKPVKIALWTVGSFLTVIIIAALSVNIWITRLVQSEIRKSCEAIPDVNVSVGNIYLSLMSGSAILTDVSFATFNLDVNDTTAGPHKPAMAVNLPTLAIWNIDYRSLLKHRRLSVFKITLDEADALIYLDEANPASMFPVFPKDTNVEKASLQLDNIAVRHIEVSDLSLRLKSLSSPLSLRLDSLSFEGGAFAYNLADSLFTYNDSVYSFSINAFYAKLPDGISEAELHDLATEDGGPLKLGYTRYRNTITPKQLADKVKEPTTWIDIQLDALTTSAINPIRKALAQDYTIDTLRAKVRRMHVSRDERYPPKTPFLPPQEYLKQIPVTFAVRNAVASISKMDIEFANTNVNCGQLHLKNLQANLASITNRRGAVWNCRMKAPFGENGHIEAAYRMHLNKNSEFDVNLQGKDIDICDMNTFLRPLIGITCDCHIDRLDADYKGDKTMASGEFCMQYHGLNVKVHKEDDIPYKVVTKNADFFTSAANTLIPKSNPTAVDIRPRAYSVEWKRDEWKPYPLYIFGPCIDGAMKTMLPGLFVHKQVKMKK